jgi:hypothetical protein
MTTQNFTIDRNHPDLKILCQLTQTNPNDIASSAFYDSQDPKKSFEAHYMRVYRFRYWSDEAKKDFEDLAKIANEQTSQYQFEINGYDDFEIEYDNDRSWPAAFHFKAILK